jgi:curved DNA-binding protein CbpA
MSTHAEYIKHLKLLGLDSKWSHFDLKVIKDRYKKLSLELHPDKNGCAGPNPDDPCSGDRTRKEVEEHFTAMSNAYSVLNDKNSKEQFEKVKQTLDNHVGKAVKDYLHGFDFHGADSYTKTVLGDAVSILEKAGYTFE